jgi:hypothetical protein
MEAKSSIKRDEAAIKNLKASGMGEVFVTSRIEKLKADIIRRTDLINELTIKSLSVGAGLCNDEVNDKRKSDQNIQKERMKEVASKKAFKRANKIAEKEISDEHWSRLKTGNNIEKQKKRDIKYGWKCYEKAMESLPDYMKRNLESMPNNKGYVWRGVHFYGDLNPERGRPHTMFERVRGVMLTTESTETEIRIYEKGKNDGKKKFISSTPRRKAGGHFNSQVQFK